MAVVFGGVVVVHHMHTAVVQRHAVGAAALDGTEGAPVDGHVGDDTAAVEVDAASVQGRARDDATVDGVDVTSRDGRIGSQTATFHIQGAVRVQDRADGAAARRQRERAARTYHGVDCPNSFEQGDLLEPITAADQLHASYDAAADCDIRVILVIYGTAVGRTAIGDAVAGGERGIGSAERDPGTTDDRALDRHHAVGIAEIIAPQHRQIATAADELDVSGDGVAGHIQNASGSEVVDLHAVPDRKGAGTAEILQIAVFVGVGTLVIGEGSEGEVGVRSRERHAVGVHIERRSAFVNLGVGYGVPSASGRGAHHTAGVDFDVVDDHPGKPQDAAVADGQITVPGVHGSGESQVLVVRFGVVRNSGLAVEDQQIAGGSGEGRRGADVTHGNFLSFSICDLFYDIFNRIIKLFL